MLRGSDKTIRQLIISLRLQGPASIDFCKRRSAQRCHNQKINRHFKLIRTTATMHEQFKRKCTITIIRFLSIPLPITQYDQAQRVRVWLDFCGNNLLSLEHCSFFSNSHYVYEWKLRWESIGEAGGGGVPSRGKVGWSSPPQHSVLINSCGKATWDMCTNDGFQVRAKLKTISCLCSVPS